MIHVYLLAHLFDSLLSYKIYLRDRVVFRKSVAFIKHLVHMLCGEPDMLAAPNPVEKIVTYFSSVDVRAMLVSVVDLKEFLEYRYLKSGWMVRLSSRFVYRVSKINANAAVKEILGHRRESG